MSCPLRMSPGVRSTVLDVLCSFLALLILALIMLWMASPVQAQPANLANAAADSVEVLEPDVAPELIKFIEADYPALQMRSGVEGSVLLEMIVTAEGLVDSVTVVTGLSPEMDLAAAEAAAQFIFKPAVVEGEAVPVYLQFEYVFSLQDQARRITEYVNFKGCLQEMGTRQPLESAMVVVSFPECGKNANLDVPWSVYLERIGSFTGQYLEEERLVTFTDSTGHFSLKSLPAGPVSLTFPNAGYEEQQVDEVVNPEELIEAKYRLRRSRYNEYEIVVYGREEEKEVTRRTLSVTEVERIPGFGGDVIKSLQALPGVARPTMDDPGAVVVRGSGNYDTRFFLEGIDIPLLFHFGGVKSTYNSLSLQSVDLYPGGYGTQFGGCIGGVVDIKGRPAKLDRWHTVLDASLMDASFHTGGPLGKGYSLSLSGRRSFIGEIMKSVTKSNENMNMAVAPYYWDFVARLDHGQNTDNHWFVTAFAAKDRMEMIVPEESEGSPTVSEATDEIEMELHFSRYILGHDMRVNDRMKNSFRFAYGRNSEGGHILGHIRFEGKGPYYQVRDDFAINWTKGIKSHVGLDFAYQPYDYEVKHVGWPTSKQDLDFSDEAGYINFELRPIENLLITPGVRYDYYRHIAEGKASARISSRWQLSEDRAITASFGNYNQPPQPIGQSTDPEYGNPDLPPTTAVHSTLGYEWRMNDRLFVKVEGYYNTQNDVPVEADSMGINFLPDGDARMYGLELMLRHEASENFFGWISYSFGRSDRRFARKPNNGYGSTWNSSQWLLHNMDQTHHIEAVGSWQLGKNWSFGTRMQFVSGVPITPNLSYDEGRYEFDADTGEYVPVQGEYNSKRMDPYFRMDIRFDKKFIKKDKIWSVYLDLQNVNYFVYNSPEGYTYNYDYSKREPYGWIFMPALGVRVEF